MSKDNTFKKNLAVLMGLSIATLHVINRIETTNACSIDKVKTREDKEYDWRYGKISYKKKGTGSPILLLHDLTIGSNKSEYKCIYDALSLNRTVYVPDIIGFGDSEKPSMTYTASVIEQMISDFIKVIIGTQTDIVVTGTTAPIILKLVHNQPRLINRIIMINPLGLYDQNLIPSNQTRLLKILMDVPIIGTFGYNINATKKQIINLFKEKYISKPSKIDEDKLNGIINDYYRSSHIGGYHSKYVQASYLSQYMTCSIQNDLKEIDNSILLIAGSDEPDIETNIENYKYYNNAIEEVIINETSHLPHIEKSEEVISNIEVFLS